MENKLYKVLIEGTTEFIGEHAECLKYVKRINHSDYSIKEVDMIQNEKQLKDANLMLQCAKKMKYPNNNRMVLGLKKVIRFYYKNQTTQKNALETLKNDEVFRLAHFHNWGYTDWYIMNEMPTKEEINEYFKENSIDSPYDCTGYIFLYSMSVYPLKSGRFLIKEDWMKDI